MLFELYFVTIHLKQSQTANLKTMALPPQAVHRETQTSLGFDFIDASLQELVLISFRKLNLCSVLRSSIDSATNWPWNTWSAWKSDSTYPSDRIPPQGEGPDPGSPATVVHVYSSGCPLCLALMKPGCLP